MPSHADNALTRINTIGVSGVNTYELLAIGLSRRESDAADVQVTAQNLRKRYPLFASLTDLSSEDLREIAGLEPFEILRAKALIEVGRRAAGAGPGEPIGIDSAEGVAALLSHLTNEKREHFCLVLLNSQNEVMRWTTIHIGTLTMSVVGPREVFREAIREGASSVIVAHNHPSGDPTPSPEDIEVTAKLVEIGKMLDIPLLDHVIIGKGKSISLRKKGHIR